MAERDRLMAVTALIATKHISKATVLAKVYFVHVKCVRILEWWLVDDRL